MLRHPSICVAVGDQHLAVAQRRRLVRDLDLHEAGGDRDDRRARARVGGGAPASRASRCTRSIRRSESPPSSSVSVRSSPRSGIVGPAPDPVDAEVLAAQQVVDRDVQRRAQPDQRRQREPALGPLGLRDRARGHAGEVAEVVLAERARAADRAQRGGDTADDLRWREDRLAPLPRASAGPRRGPCRRGPPP